MKTRKQKVKINGRTATIDVIDLGDDFIAKMFDPKKVKAEKKLEKIWNETLKLNNAHWECLETAYSKDYNKLKTKYTVHMIDNKTGKKLKVTYTGKELINDYGIDEIAIS